MTDQYSIQQHYRANNILSSILDGLVAAGKDIQQLVPEDLLAVDAFHIRGREASIELAEKANIKKGQRVLDVGCALGGSARFLAARFGCQVYGIDITESYIEAATDLSRRTGFADQVFFEQASALALPYESASFDVVWTEHVQMNIEDKVTFYAEIARVLKPQGQLLFHDVFQGYGQNLYYPVPWASSADINYLIKPDSTKKILAEVGLQVVEWQDKTAHSLKWLQARSSNAKKTPSAAIGLHLLMGNNIAEKITNLVRNIEQGNIVIVQCLAQKS